MKIFLSSTAHDLSDFRELVVDRLQKDGHEVLFHESPTFPARIGLHSHDQCLEAIKESDLVICLIDKRYGGKYAGQILNPFTPLSFEILGCIKSGTKKKFNIKYHLQQMSITWCEIYTAHKEAIPVMTFARQRTLDEKETRRRNQYLLTFRPAYTEKNEVFDFIDWITQRRTNNWIAPFISIVDFEKKLFAWMNEFSKSIYSAPANENTYKLIEKSRICIIVEGEVDRLFVYFLLQKLNLIQHFVIIPMYGKYQILNNFTTFIEQYSKTFAYVMLLLDSDAQTEDEYNENKRQFQELIKFHGNNNVLGFFANPSIESWIAAGLDKTIYNQYQGFIDKKRFNKHFGQLSINHIKELLLHKFSCDDALKLNADLQNFVEHLKDLVIPKQQ